MYSRSYKSADRQSRAAAFSSSQNHSPATLDQLASLRNISSVSIGRNVLQREIGELDGLHEVRSNKQFPEWLGVKIDEVLALGKKQDTQVDLDNLQVALQVLQYNVEFWRDQTRAEDWDEISLSWKQLHGIVVGAITACSEEKNKINPAETGSMLAKNFESALVSLAMRITVTNSSHVSSTDFARERNINHAKQVSGDKLPERQGLAPNLGGDTRESLARKADKLDAKGAGVCSEFAASAASLLAGKGVRVEIMGTSVGAHNYVVVGRPADTDSTNPNAWRNGTCVVDCWWGAMKWRGYGEPFPQVIWDPVSHMQMGNVPNAVLYDSDPPGGKPKNPLLEALANLKKTK